MVSPGDFQSYCDRWFGLDCNGFVGNYIRHVYQCVHWSDANDSVDSVESNDLISTIWTKFEGVEYSLADDVDADRLNLLVMTDDRGVVVPGGKPPHGHIMISVPGESAVIRNTKRRLPGSADANLPAITIVESTASKDGVDGLSGLARSFYAYSESGSQARVFKVLRGLNDGVMNVRIKGASWIS